MSVEIVMPRAGLTMVEGTIGTWKAAEGSHISKGDVIMEYENEKNMIDYEALTSGILHILAQEGDTVKVDGKVVEDARVVTEQFLPQGPAAPQVAIKQSGTNGGGFFGVNSAHPYENPSAFTNIIEMTSLLLIPAACCFTFGIGVKNTKQGKAIFAAMFILLVIFTGIIAVNEHAGTPQLADDGAVNIEMTDGQAGGNMEGKESRFGIAASSTWSACTTAASNG